MYHVGLDTGVKENNKSNRAKFKNHQDWEEWKASKFPSCMLLIWTIFLDLNVE